MRSIARVVTGATLILSLLAGCSSLGNRGARTIAADDSSLRENASRTLSRLSESLTGMQKDTGEWVQVIELDSVNDIMALVLAKRLGFERAGLAPGLAEETIDRVFRAQDLKTGLWTTYPGGAPDPSITGIVLMGLRYWGQDSGRFQENDPRVAKAWQWFRTQGGPSKIGGLGKMIAFFAELSPDAKFFKIPPQFLALPKQSPVNVFNIGIGRTFMIPLSVMEFYRTARLGHKKARPLDPARRASAGSMFGHASRHSKEFWVQEGLGWLLGHISDDGTWCGALQITFFSLIALQEAQDAGVADFSEQIRKAWSGILAWRTRLPSGQVIQQFGVGPVMDTARVLSAYSTTARGARPSLLEPQREDRAVQWLLDHQLFNPADFLYNAPEAPAGGWTFQYWNHLYPDTDDTGMVLEALATSRNARTPAVLTSIDRGLKWLLAMQNKDGGYAAWDRDNSKLIAFVVNLGIPGVPEGWDGSQNDITARIVRGLAAIRDAKVAGESAARVERAIERACSFLEKSRKHMTLEDGQKDKKDKKGLPLWSGQWMVDYLYGTTEALDSLLKSGCWSVEQGAPYAQWLAARQTASGGWGESQESYVKSRYVEGPTTLSQTEFVLNSLLDYESSRIAAGSGAPSVRTAIDRGIAFLIDRMGDAKYPSEEDYTGTFLPKAMYGRYLSFPHYEGVRVLGKYLKL